MCRFLSNHNTSLSPFFLEFSGGQPVVCQADPYPPGAAEYFNCYDELREATRVWPSPIDFMNTRFHGKKVLDVGSGNGYV